MYLETSSPGSPRTEQGDSNWGSLRGSESELVTGVPSPTETLIIRADADTPCPAPAPDQGRSEPESLHPGWGLGMVLREEGAVHQVVWAGLTLHLLLLQGRRAPENPSAEPLAPAQPLGWSRSYCPLLRHWEALNQLCIHILLLPTISVLEWGLMEECQRWGV